MEESAVAWYYLIFVLVVGTFFLAADFSPINTGLRLFILFALFLAFLGPIAFMFAAKKEHRTDEASVNILSAANKDLEQSVKELEAKNKELEATNSHLAKVDKSKSEFVSSVAHQLRTPLSAIKWTFHMMLNGELGPVTPDQKEFLQKGFESASRVITVVNDWLNVDYIEANRDDYKFVPVNLAELVDGVGFEFNARLKEKQLKLTVERAKSNMPPVEVDPIKFSMVVENLIDNAIKYGRAGSEIIVKINDDRIHDAKPEIELSVADQGIGIPEAEKSKIFQRYFRSSSALKSSPQGTGLGLAICKSIVERHGGRIWFASRESEGTTFYVAIPLKQNKV